MRGAQIGRNVRGRRIRPDSAKAKITVEPPVAIDLFQNKEAIRQLEAKADEFDKLADSLGDTVDLRRLARSYRVKAEIIKKETADALGESAQHAIERFFEEDR